MRQGQFPLAHLRFCDPTPSAAGALSAKNGCPGLPAPGSVSSEDTLSCTCVEAPSARPAGWPNPPARDVDESALLLFNYCSAACCTASRPLTGMPMIAPVSGLTGWRWEAF